MVADCGEPANPARPNPLDQRSDWLAFRSPVSAMTVRPLVIDMTEAIAAKRP
jgi:hypothetical protein